MSHEVVVIDYHKGNLQSVARSIAASAADVDVAVSDDPAQIASARGLILPGVGAFEDAMSYLASSGEADAIKSAIGRGTPFLGICLGLHLLFERGSERSSAASSGTKDAPVPAKDDVGDGAWIAGLGIIRGSVSRLESSRLKVPHVGWDQLYFTPTGQECPLFVDVPEGANVYFTHSYAVDDDAPEDVVCARTHYVRSFPSAVWRDNVFGVQFHPEKSSRVGLSILHNFMRVVRG